MLLGERIKQLAEEFDVNNRDLAELLGFNQSAPAKWRERAKQGKDYDTASLRKVAARLHYSEDYLDGLCDEPRWNANVLRAQESMRDFARHFSIPGEAASAERLIAAWEQFRSMVNMGEDIWSFYLRWTPADWERCKRGELSPSGVQRAGASQVTGIPERWFWDGDTRCLAPLTDSARKRLEELMAAENVGPEDLIRAYRQSKIPRR